MNFGVPCGWLVTTLWSNEKSIARVPNHVARKELWHSTGESTWISSKTTRTTVDQSPARAEIECWSGLIASFECYCNWIACWKTAGCANLQTYDQWWASLWGKIVTSVQTAWQRITTRSTRAKICILVADIIITCVYWHFQWIVVANTRTGWWWSAIISSSCVPYSIDSFIASTGEWRTCKPIWT